MLRGGFVLYKLTSLVAEERKQVRLEFSRKTNRLYHIFGEAGFKGGTLWYDEVFHQNTMNHQNTNRNTLSLSYVQISDGTTSQ